MKKTIKEALKVKLLKAFKKVIKENKAYLSSSTEKALEKSIKKIVKKTSQKENILSKMKTPVLLSNKFRQDGLGNAQLVKLVR